MVHPDMFLKVAVTEIVKPDMVKDDHKIYFCKEFTIDQMFSAREHMLEWVRIETRKLGFDIVIGRSHNGNGRGHAFSTMTRERSWKYVPKIRKLTRDDTGLRKCECSFKLRGYCKTDDTWQFNVISGIHNHDMETKLQGHPIVYQLKLNEKALISDMALTNVASRNMLADLKRKSPDNVSNINQVYNEIHNIKMEIRGPRTEMQQLLKLLDDNHYVSRYRVCDNKVSVCDIFWTHTESIKLFNTFLTVLIIDSTYMTNKYRLPLLEIVDVTSMDKTFSVGFSFLESNKEENFTWALDIWKSLLKDKNKMPSVIVTDRDDTLMNAVEKVFPTSYALLCRYHITKNMRSQLKPTIGTKIIKGEDGKLVKSGVIAEKIMSAWTSIVNASTKELYVEAVMKKNKEKSKNEPVLDLSSGISFGAF